MPSLVTSVIGGIQGASAATNAANGAMQYATDAGNQVGAANTAASKQALDAAAAAKAGVTSAATTAGAGVTQGAVDANSRLDPYAKTGAAAASTLGSMYGEGGAGMKNFSRDDFTADPGYAFRLQEGQKALERSQSARGATGSGGASKALARYAQGAASQEYGAAFDRFRTQNNDRFAQLSTLSDSGQRAATTQGGNTLGAARYAGDVGVDASKYGGNADMQTAQHVGDNGLQTARYQGDVGINAAQYGGNVQVATAGRQSDNTMHAGDIVGNGQVSAGNARANGTLGRAAAWNGMLSGIGSAANGIVAGGFGGGGGFNLGGAVRGLVPQKPGASSGGYDWD